MSVAVQMICSDRSDRLAVGLDATMRDASSRPVDVEIEDISVSGFRMLTKTDLQTGELITVGIAGLGMQPAVVVRRTPGRYGCRFVNAVSQDYLDQLQLGTPAPAITTFVPAWDLPRPDAEPEIERYPVAVRLLVIGGLGVTCWGVLIGAALLIF